EDGIRDFHVTGVQTCALPIYPADGDRRRHGGTGRDRPGLGLDRADQPVVRLREPASLTRRTPAARAPRGHRPGAAAVGARTARRSEERRVGKEGRSRAWEAKT